MTYIVLFLGLICGFLWLIALLRDYEGSIIFFIIASVCSIFILVGGTIIIPSMKEVSEYEKVTSRRQILNLQSKSNEEDIFISVDAEGNYTYYYEQADGGKIQKKAKSTETKIYEEEICEQPEIITYTTYEKEEWDELFYKVMFFDTHTIKEKETGKRYEIHIPKGTIKY